MEQCYGSTHEALETVVHVLGISGDPEPSISSLRVSRSCRRSRQEDEAESGTSGLCRIQVLLG